MEKNDSLEINMIEKITILVYTVFYVEFVIREIEDKKMYAYDNINKKQKEYPA